MMRSRSSRGVEVLPSLEVPAVRELAERDAWVCWRRCANRRTGKVTKVPYTPAGSKASITNPTTWSSYREVFEATYVQGLHHGIGRVLTGDDDLVGIDLDGCLDLATGAFLHTFAERVVLEVASYSERSPSGTGAHVWCRGSWPTDGSRRYGIEVYKRGRYLTVTGDHLAGTPEDIRRADLAPLWERLQARSRVGASRGAMLVSLPESPAAVDLAHLVRRHPQLGRIVSGCYPSESERDLAVVRFAKLSGRAPADAWALMCAARTDGKAERVDYAAYTIARVYSP
jgi:putative DNA primase/helicase